LTLCATLDEFFQLFQKKNYRKKLLFWFFPSRLKKRFFLNNNSHGPSDCDQGGGERESSPFSPRGRHCTRTEIGRRFPLQAAEGAQRLQLLPPFQADDG